VNVARPSARRGRPTLYRPEHAEQAFKLCLLGATDDQIADVFAVHHTTIDVWKRDRPEFARRLKAGKAFADAEVAYALYQRAIGYSHPEIHVSSYRGEITLTEVIRHYPPDTGAAIFWLSHRQPDLWSDRVKGRADRDTRAFPSDEQLDTVYEAAMARARARQKMLVGRRERLGIEVGQAGD
jgi:hypothetical protein